MPEQERKLVSALRSLILRCIPECQETLSYNIPIYKRHGGFSNIAWVCIMIRIT